MSKQQPTRRTFLARAAGAACSAGAFHPALAQRAARRVVVIGGGFCRRDQSWYALYVGRGQLKVSKRYARPIVSPEFGRDAQRRELPFQQLDNASTTSPTSRRPAVRAGDHVGPFDSRGHYQSLNRSALSCVCFPRRRPAKLSRYRPRRPTGSRPAQRRLRPGEPRRSCR